MFWHPARLDMQLRHSPVIALKKGQKILGQIVFVELRERTHNAEIESDIAPERLGRIGHIDVSGMHIGVEESVGKHLCEENFDTSARQTLDIDPRSEEHTSELQSLMRSSYAVFCLKK